MAAVSPTPGVSPGAPNAGGEVAGQQQQQHQQEGGGGQPGGEQQGYYGQTELFLSNYRLGKTLGIGSFGKVHTPRPERLH
jgi:hypothetical protein